MHCTTSPPKKNLTRLRGPVIVYVFPDPVWPYAKAVQEYLNQQQWNIDISYCPFQICYNKMGESACT